MSIRGFRLTSSEIVLTQVKERKEGIIILKDPAQMVMQEIEPGRAGVGLQPFLPFGSNIELYVGSITAEFDVDVQVENEYNRIFGAGIVIAGANDIPVLK